MGKIQLQVLIDYMEVRSLFARGQIRKLGPQVQMHNHKFQNMWIELASRLYLIGPCKKNVEGWKKTWVRLRLKAKMNKAKFLKSYYKTGHEDPECNLSIEDERISSIYGIHGTGPNIVQELGLPNLRSSISWATPNNYRRKASNKPCNCQMEILIDFMERHQDFARDYSSNADELWQVVVTLLNSAEGATKSEKRWEKTWTDLIASARQNMSLMLNGLRDTPISNNHMRVLQLVEEEDFHKTNSGSSKKMKFVDLSDEPSTSGGIYHIPFTQATRIPSAAVGLTTQSHMSQSTIRPIIRQPQMMSKQPPASNIARSNFSNRNLPQSSQARPRATTTKSEHLLKNFEQKGSELLGTLVTQITSCFEKYTDVIKQCLEKQTREICDLIAEQVQIPVNEESQENVIEQEETVSGLFLDLLDDDEDEEILEDDLFPQD